MSCKQFPGYQKLDALLRLALDEAQPGDVFSLLIRVEGVADPRAAIARAGVIVDTVSGSICTARDVTDAQIRILAAQDWVVRIVGSRDLYPDDRP